MNKIAKFSKVSFSQFLKSIEESTDFSFNEKEIQEMYELLRKPKRATTGSAGYDFYAPFSFTLKPGETIKFPTGIRCRMNEGWVLMLFPRSGLGFKYRCQLDNTVGVIDSDYYNSDNEGHMMAKITNDSKDGKELTINKGEAYMQGVFLPFGLTEDDETDGIRNGGFGSTSR